jgi:hypothetical protein
VLAVVSDFVLLKDGRLVEQRARKSFVDGNVTQRSAPRSIGKDSCRRAMRSMTDSEEYDAARQQNPFQHRPGDMPGVYVTRVGNKAGFYPP